MSDGRFSNLEFDDARADRKDAPNGAGKAEGQPSHGARIKDAAHYLQQAEKSELAGNREEALRNFSAVLNENPLLLDGWIGQLIMLLALQEYPEARIWADKALESFPDNPQALAAKAVALHHMGHHREARELIDAAAAAKGDFFAVWFCRGEIMLSEGVPAAESCLQHALRVAPRKDLGQIRVGELLLHHRKFSSALSLLQEAVTVQPRSAWAWYLLGLTQRKLGLSSRARLSFQQAAQLVPQDRVFAAAAWQEKGLVPAIAGFFRRLSRR